MPNHTPWIMIDDEQPPQNYDDTDYIWIAWLNGRVELAETEAAFDWTGIIMYAPSEATPPPLPIDVAQKIEIMKNDILAMREAGQL